MVIPLPFYPWATLAAMHVQAIVAYRGSVRPENRDRMVKNPFFTWWWIRCGQAEIESSGKRWIAGTGSWILIPPEIQRRQRLTDDVVLLSVSFDWSWTTRVPVIFSDNPIIGEATKKGGVVSSALRFIRAVEDAQGTGNISLLNRRLSVAEWLHSESAFRLFLDRLLVEVVARGARLSQPGVSDARIQHVLRDLMNHLHAGPLPYARWQEQISLSRAQIDRLAQASLGVTLHEWRNRFLADEIRKRLMRSGVSIKETAADLGFVDSAHFNKWVVRHLGQNPTTFKGTST